MLRRHHRQLVLLSQGFRVLILFYMGKLEALARLIRLVFCSMEAKHPLALYSYENVIYTVCVPRSCSFY